MTSKRCLVANFLTCLMIACSMLLLRSFSTRAIAQGKEKISITPVGLGWAKNSVNTVIFRKNSIVSINGTQYIAYYDEGGRVVVGKRALGEQKWQLAVTPYTGNVADAHNAISIMVDGVGYLHLSWDHHNGTLNYCRSKHPNSLEMGEKMAMTGKQETRVTYPEFYRMPNGNLLFFYRNGESGKGNLIINQYDLANQRWRTLHDNLIDGEGERNAYVQACVDKSGIIHLSWVWRESADVASNHDMCYARSRDGGVTWEQSNGKPYALPITAGTAEYAARIPQNSGLINQTSMTTDERGSPIIATYWKDKKTKVTQYHLLSLQQGHWITKSLSFRKRDFSLGGVGTKRIPISRPQVLALGSGNKQRFYLIFRDEERANYVSLAVMSAQNEIEVIDIYKKDVGAWEPSFDTALWDEKKILHLYVQHVEQADGEGKTDFPPQMVNVLEWKP